MSSLNHPIPFTQFTLPFGKRSQIQIMTDEEAGKLADQIIAQGTHRFECEVLTTGDTSITCADMIQEIDIAIELIFPSTDPQVALSKLVRDAHKIVFGG
jgi:hypothetical protein